MAVWPGLAKRNGRWNYPVRPGHNIYPDERSDDGAEHVYPEERSEDFYPAECNEDVYPDEHSEDVAEAD